jgi:hypothetical protein
MKDARCVPQMMNFDIFGAAQGKDFALLRGYFFNVAADALVPSRGRHIGRQRRLIWRVFIASSRGRREVRSAGADTQAMIVWVAT